MDGRDIGIGEGRCVGVPVSLLVGDVTLQNLENRSVEALCLSISLEMISSGEFVMPSIANTLEKVPDELGAVVRQDCGRDTLLEDQFVCEGGRYGQCFNPPKGNPLSKLCEVVDDDQDEAIPLFRIRHWSKYVDPNAG